MSSFIELDDLVKFDVKLLVQHRLGLDQDVANTMRLFLGEGVGH